MSLSSPVSSRTPVPGPASSPAPVAVPPRVRHQAREAVTLMVFSALTSVGIAAVFLVLTALGRQV